MCDVSRCDTGQTPFADSFSVAKDRAWFSDYTPFETETTSLMGGSIQIIGIGTVELPIEPPPGFVGDDSPRTLRLTNVLHAPSCLCNILGGPILEDYTVTPARPENTKGYITDKNGRNVAYFDASRPLSQVKLRNPPSGYYALSHRNFYYINAIWPDSEREKWHAHKNTPGESFSLQEKVWLKKHYGNEFSFLQAHELSIYKDEDRKEGRTILRALMEAEKGNTGA